MQAFFSIIGRAKHYVYIQTPYFLPNESLLTALQTAAMSGVDVRLMVPESTDTPLASLAMQSHFSEVMAAGVKIYRYKKGFLHAKTLVCDDSISTVGSTNFDYRSFELDFEVNAFVYDADFARRMKETFLHDMDDAAYLDPEVWSHRRKTTKWIESVSRLFGPLM